MGAEIELDGGYIVATAPKGLKGARFTFPKVSVGATENLMMAAALAKGTTVLDNAAREPEITDLAECLVEHGRAGSRGIGTETLTHRRRRARCTDATHRVIPDRIETGTYAMAVAMTGGRRRAGRRPARPDRGGGADAARGRRRRSTKTERGFRVQRDQRRAARRRRDDRALSRLPDRPAGADDGADDARPRAPR